MQEYYPDGAELMVLINDPRIDKEFLHFGARYLPASKEEYAEYRRVCEIVDSRAVSSSTKVRNGLAIAHCTDVTNGEWIRYSEHIADCKNVYNSNNIFDSEEVWNGANVKKSKRVMDSNEVVYSEDVARGNAISWSKFIFDSSMIEESTYVYNSHGLNDCHFVGFMKNCKHCLFCTGLTDKEYFIFNKEVSRAEYEKWCELLKAKAEGEPSSFIVVDKETHLAEERYSVPRRMDAVFEGLSADFFGWVGTMEHYNEDIFLRVFLTDPRKKSDD